MVTVSVNRTVLVHMVRHHVAFLHLRFGYGEREVQERFFHSLEKIVSSATLITNTKSVSSFFQVTPKIQMCFPPLTICLNAMSGDN
jgi:hypothetical protein